MTIVVSIVVNIHWLGTIVVTVGIRLGKAREFIVSYRVLNGGLIHGIVLDGFVGVVVDSGCLCGFGFSTSSIVGVGTMGRTSGLGRLDSDILTFPVRAKLTRGVRQGILQKFLTICF